MNGVAGYFTPDLTVGEGDSPHRAGDPGFFYQGSGSAVREMPDRPMPEPVAE